MFKVFFATIPVSGEGLSRNWIILLGVEQQLMPLRAEIPDGLPEREGEPQVARILEGAPVLAGKVPRYLQW
jgi:hypothetical protein